MNRWRKPFAIITVATALAGGFYVISNDGGGSSPGLYNVFVSSSGNNSATNCQWYTPAQADPGGQVCLTLAKACSLQPANTTGAVLVRNDGNYASQLFTNSDCPNSSSAHRLTFTGQTAGTIPDVGAASDAPYLDGACTNACDFGLEVGDTGSGNGPSYITMTNFRVSGEMYLNGNKLRTTSGTVGIDLAVSHFTSGAIHTSGVTNVSVTNSDFGDCYTSLIPNKPSSRCTASQSNDWAQTGSAPNRASSSGTWSGNWFHDYRACPLSDCASPDDHSESMFFLDWSDVVFENNKLWNTSVSCGIRIERIDSPASGVLLDIRNNWFGDCYEGFHVGTGYTGHRCEGITWGANSGALSNVLIRYNTFVQGEGPFGSSGSPTSTFRIIANFVGANPNDGDEWSCEVTPPDNNYASATVNWNVWVGSNQGSNSATVANTAAFNALLVNSTGGASGKPDLANTTNPPNDYVTCTSGDMQLGTDFYGTTRTNPCDAGAYEH